ncbi:MAG: alpha/beta hydrolase [Clostridia bacterium]
MRMFDFVPYEGTEAVVTAYLHDAIDEMNGYRKEYPSVIVCPGGGYQFCSQRESDPVVFEYLSKGYNVFLLIYSLKENASNFNPLKEVSSTIMKIRENAKEWNCEPEQIAVCGFSAGGHLAGSIATLWNNETFLKYFDNKGGLNKPNAVVLGYPAICNSCFTEQSPVMIVQGEEIDEFYDFFTLEKRVTKDTAPSFIWHTYEDTVVPVKNALAFADALNENKIQFEIHIFPTGGHGMSVCTNEVNAQHSDNRKWVDLSVGFLNKMFGYEF